MKNGKDDDKMTRFNDQTSPGRVKQICQNFLLHSDFGLAHRLQQEEYETHFDRNRTHSRECRLGVKTARDVEAEERQTFIAKQFDSYRQKQDIEENDTALAKQLQGETNSRSTNSTHHHSSINQNFYENVNLSSICQDTSNDEQLARILQEEEQILSSDGRSHYNPEFV